MGEEEGPMAPGDEEALTELYRELYRGMISKDRSILDVVLDPGFVLVHMTGMRQSKEQFIRAVEDGTLNYFSEEPDEVAVTVRSDRAEIVGHSRVNAAVFGGGRHTWRLALDISCERRGGGWTITRAEASTYRGAPASPRYRKIVIGSAYRLLRAGVVKLGQRRRT